MSSLEPGQIILYYQEERLRAGLVLALAESRCTVLESAGGNLRLDLGRIILASEQIFSPQTPDSLKSFLDQVLRLAGDYSSGWELPVLEKTGAPFSFADACRLLQAETDVQRFALYHYLRGQPDRYSWKKGLISLRGEAERNRYLEEQQAEQDRLNFLEQVSAWLDQKKADKAAMPAEQVRLRLAAELRGLLQSGDNRELGKLLRRHDPSQAQEAVVHSLRLALGDLDADTDPVASSYGIPVNFEPGLAEQASAALLTDPADPGAFSIDAEDSPDHDDAISLCKTANGWLLGIHISNVATRVPLESGLYAACRDRVSSLYLAPGAIPLLPERLSEADFSLVAGAERPVISLYAKFDASFSLLGWEFRPEMIRIRENLHYAKVDSQISEQPYTELLRLARKLETDRQGKQQGDRPRFSWQLTARAGAVGIRRVDNESPSRFIVEELMVLYNRLFAEYALHKGVPLIFRNISQFLEDEDDAESTVLGIQAFLSTEARFHPGIGAQAYVHATSPIRRFTDIVNQYQFLSALQGAKPPFDRDGLDQLIPSIEKRLQLLREISHRSERYWLLRLLEQKYLNTPLDAVLIRKLRHGYLAELSPWDKRIILHTDGKQPLQTELKIVIGSVDLDDFSASGDVIL